MPGIYVRKASWIDWTQKGENPALMVPGSYWLCHKDNMYKFIFKYHRSTRNKKNFNYGKELMKIIRRIIKSQPPQGQQFGTSHLLVSFNRTSWTRQDKMFAMMQFKERSVRAFSHAFILTIKVSHPMYTEHNAIFTKANSPSVESLNQTENVNIVHENKNAERNEKCLIHSIKGDNIQKETVKSENIGIELHNDIANSNFKDMSINKISQEQIHNNETGTKVIKNSNASFIVPITSDDIKLHSGVMKTSSSSEINSIKYSKSSFEKFDTKNIELLNNETNLDQFNVRKNSSNNSLLYGNSTFNDTNIDSVNLPYQYLIEKEIENAKQNSENYSLAGKNERDAVKPIETNSDATKIQNSLCSKKKTYGSNNIARSSDITDLVMEGLMFTIRQGQDTVAVIEQKTKVEVDEVLENSEEIETEEGEKCLRNSSLLGLENLITMIDLPKGHSHEQNKPQIAVVKHTISGRESMEKHLLNDTEHTSNNTEIREDLITSQVKYVKQKPIRNISSLPSTSFPNNDHAKGIKNKTHYSDTYNSSVCEENMKFSEIKHFEFEEHDKEEVEEEEDIIPEALRYKIVESSVLSITGNNSERELKSVHKKGLLMDDAKSNDFKNVDNTEHTSKSLQPRLHLRYSPPDNNLQKESIDVSTNSIMNGVHNNITNQCNLNHGKCKSGGPVVISNQVIMLNQIPLQIRKILKRKLLIQGSSLDSKTENYTDIYERETATQERNMQLKCESDEISTNIQSLNEMRSVNDAGQIYNETLLFTAPNAELEDKNKSENARVSEKNLEGQNNGTGEVDMTASKIKDITQQFYQDISDLQRKRHSINQKYLRSRRKSLKVLSGSNNSEMPIQMVKLFEDITRGAKVVVRRISINKYL